MSRWYRAYAGTVKDDKLAEVSVIAGCSRSVAIAVWHAILESAAETDDGGRFETTPRRVAAALCEPLGSIQAVFDAMAEIAMIGGDSVTAWKARQYESDKSTERSRKHREARRNGVAALQGRCATPPDTETEADTEETSTDVPVSSAPTVEAIPRQAQPEAGQGKIDYEEVQKWASGLVGSQPVALNLDISPIVTLLRAGFSRERVEIGIRAACASRKDPVRSWKAFEGWIKNTSAEQASIAKPIVSDEARWARMLKSHAAGNWSDHWGQPPGSPGCKIPVSFIEAPPSHSTQEEAA